MKTVLEFNMPDDSYDFECCLRGPAVIGELRSIFEMLRLHKKHGSKLADAQMVDQVYREISSILSRFDE